MLKEDQEWIDNASYAELLRVWRHTPAGGDRKLVGKTGTYFAKSMAEKKKGVDHVAISKEIGWE